MKNIGTIYNIFVCFVIGITGTAVFYLLQKRRKKGGLDYNQGLDYFSLLLGTVWGLVGIRFVLIYIGKHELALSLFKWIIGPLAYLHLLPLFYYFSWSFFKDKKNAQLIFNTFFTVIAALVVISLFVYGFEEPEIDYWGSKIKANDFTTGLFGVVVFMPGLFIILIELVRRYRRWKKSKSLAEKKLFIFSLGFLVYALTGLFEVIFYQRGWQVLLVRIGIMIAPFVFYFSATLEE